VGTVSRDIDEFTFAYRVDVDIRIRHRVEAMDRAAVTGRDVEEVPAIVR